jgi:hypothetical protein
VGSGAAVFGVFLLFSWLIGSARGGGEIRQSFLDAYEQVHGWLNIGLFSMLGVSFLWRVGSGIFRGSDIMRSRLDELLDRDTASRWRVISISALAVAALGCVFSGVNHRSPSETLPYAVFFGAIVFAIQVLLYCTRTELATIKQYAGIMPRRLVFAVVSAGTIVLLATVPAPMLEGAVLNRRLLVLTRDGKLSSERAEQVQACLELASSIRVRLPPSTSTHVRDLILDAAAEDPNSRALQKAALALSKYDHEVFSAPILAIVNRAPRTGAETAYRKAIEIELRFGIEEAERSEARSLFTQAIELAATNDTALLSECYLQRGGLFTESHDYDEGLSDSDRAMKLVRWI